MKVSVIFVKKKDNLMTNTYAFNVYLVEISTISMQMCLKTISCKKKCYFKLKRN